MRRTKKNMETLRTLYEQYDALRVLLKLPTPNEVVWFTTVDGERCIDVTHDGLGTFRVVLYKGDNPNDRMYYKVADFYLDEKAAIKQAIQWAGPAYDDDDDDDDIPDEGEEQ